MAHQDPAPKETFLVSLIVGGMNSSVGKTYTETEMYFPIGSRTIIYELGLLSD